MFHWAVTWELEMLRDEREESRLSLNSGGIRAGMTRKMTMRRTRMVGTPYKIQWLMIRLRQSDRGDPGDREVAPAEFIVEILVVLVKFYWDL
ncbi:hypothetical protein NL676_028963 [Syzygium grande]|nr:hypothetical protein NL676_028963 [Syzygium grande]